LTEADEIKQETLFVEIDLEKSEKVRCWWPFLRDRRIDYYDLSKRFIDEQ
jgi:N-carbamoylputrescine amidase